MGVQSFAGCALPMLLGLFSASLRFYAWKVSPRICFWGAQIERGCENSIQRLNQQLYKKPKNESSFILWAYGGRFFIIRKRGTGDRLSAIILVPQQNPPNAIDHWKSEQARHEATPDAVFTRDTAPTNLSSRILLSPKKSNFIRNQKIILSL